SDPTLLRGQARSDRTRFERYFLPNEPQCLNCTTSNHGTRAARSEFDPHICKPKSARQARHECGIFMPAGIRDTAQQHASGIKPAADLLPGVYEDLRRLARARLARLKPGPALQTNALAHEA